jgi:hypothetical protein
MIDYDEFIAGPNCLRLEQLHVRQQHVEEVNLPILGSNIA